MRQRARGGRHGDVVRPFIAGHSRGKVVLLAGRFCKQCPFFVKVLLHVASNWWCACAIVALKPKANSRTCRLCSCGLTGDSSSLVEQCAFEHALMGMRLMPPPPFAGARPQGSTVNDPALFCCMTTQPHSARQPREGIIELNGRCRTIFGESLPEARSTQTKLQKSSC